MILSAPSGVNIGVMEKDLEAMNILWNTLKQAMAEKERKDSFNPENIMIERGAGASLVKYHEEALMIY